MALKTYADGSIFGERHGTGEPRVLALHGWGRDRSDFARALDGLDAVSIDLPGFGASPSPPQVIGAAGYAELVAPVVAAFARPPVLVGHSFGGRVAVALASTSPASVAGLVLVGAPLLHRGDRGPQRPPVAYRLAKWANRRGLLSDERLEQKKRSSGSEDYRAASGVMRDILVKAVNESYEDELSDVRCRVRLVWGENDDEVPVSVARRAADLLADASVDVVAGVGHHVLLLAPNRVRAAIEGLL